MSTMLVCGAALIAIVFVACDGPELVMAIINDLRRK